MAAMTKHQFNIISEVMNLFTEDGAKRTSVTVDHVWARVTVGKTAARAALEYMVSIGLLRKRAGWGARCALYLPGWRKP